VLVLVEKPLKGFMSIARLRGRDREDGGEAEGVYSWPRKEEIAPWVGDLGGAVAQTCGAVQACVDEGRLSVAIYSSAVNVETIRWGEFYSFYAEIRYSRGNEGFRWGDV
jgi:hypothetical protein